MLLTKRSDKNKKKDVLKNKYVVQVMYYCAEKVYFFIEK